MPADSDGTSDPFFKLNYCGVEIKSEVIEDTLNPVKYVNIFQCIKKEFLDLESNLSNANSIDKTRRFSTNHFKNV